MGMVIDQRPSFTAKAAYRTVSTARMAIPGIIEKTSYACIGRISIL
jgi:hypothetical protein